MDAQFLFDYFNFIPAQAAETRDHSSDFIQEKLNISKQDAVILFYLLLVLFTCFMLELACSFVNSVVEFLLVVYVFYIVFKKFNSRKTPRHQEQEQEDEQEQDQEEEQDEDAYLDLENENI